MKRVVCALLSFVIIVDLFLIYPDFTAKAESVYVKKIVSVVYDDSGSMASYGSPNWSYASYAMQAFTSLLNSDDQLYITYMSQVEDNPNYSPQAIDLSEFKIQSSIDSIRKHDTIGNTPYSAIDVAYNKLKSVSDSNERTQYWLVVITDGAFQDQSGEISTKELNSKFSSITKEKMPNGTTPQMTYMAIGKGAVKPKGDASSGIYVYESVGSVDIVKTMSDIADRVSGRSRLDKSCITKTAADTITVESAIPLFNIAVLSQNADAKIAKASYENGKDLKISRNVSISYPQMDQLTTDKSLKAGAFMIKDPNANISAGKYTIKFDKKIDLENLDILFEPALELQMIVSSGNKEIKTLSELSNKHSGEKIDVRCEIYEVGSNKQISPSLLPKGTTFDISVFENGQAKAQSSSSDMTLNGIELHNVPTNIVGSVTINGFNPITVSTGVFTPKDAVAYTIDVSTDDKISLTMEELKSNTKKVYFTIYADGKKLSASDVKNVAFSVDTKIPGTISYETDGRISFTPTYKEPVTAIPIGDVLIKGVVNDKVSAETTIYIKPIEYTLRCTTAEENEVIRTKLRENKTGITFELLADDKKLDKEAVEAANIKFNMNSPYDEKLSLDVQIDDDGTITAVPYRDKWEWFNAYIIPTGDLTITADFNGVTADGKLVIGEDLLYELIFNLLTPLAIFLFILGHITKKRFNYFASIRTNTRNNEYGLSASQGGWRYNSLFTPKAFIPFITDTKTIKGVRFYANSRLWQPKMISVKVSQCPRYSGKVSAKLSHKKPISISTSQFKKFKDTDKRFDMYYGTTILASSNQDLDKCKFFLYTK